MEIEIEMSALPNGMPDLKTRRRVIEHLKLTDEDNPVFDRREDGQPGFVVYVNDVTHIFKPRS